MELPTPEEFTKAGGYHPFPGKWDKWLNAVRDEILTSQPQAGRHVTIDEHPGKGTVINIDDASARRGGGGGVPLTGACCIDLACSVVTAAVCADSGGIYLGDGTNCDSAPCCPNPDTVTVGFSNILIGDEDNGECDDGNPLCKKGCGCQTQGVTHHFKAIEISVNTSFMLTKTVDTGTLTQWETALPGAFVHFLKYHSDTDCVCDDYPDHMHDPPCPCDVPPCFDPLQTCDQSVSPESAIVLQCNEGVWILEFAIPSFDVCFSGWGGEDIQIYRAVGSFSDIQTNQIHCGETGTGFSIANQGTASIS